MEKQTKLSVVFDVLSIKQAQVVRALAAKGIKFSTTSLSRLKTQNEWPKHCKRPEIEQHITEYLRAYGATDEQLSGLFGWDEPEQLEDDEEDEMSKKKSPQLTPSAMSHFKVRRNPFDDPRSWDELFLLDSHIQQLEELLAVAEASSMVAVTGECGSGKSTLRRAFVTKIKEDHENIIVIEPSRFDRKKLTADGISMAIGRELGIQCSARGEKLDNEVKRGLIESCNSGNKHILIIDQAQDLTDDMIRHLKCIWEVESGFQRVIGIALFGQPELDAQLDQPKLREFTWRSHRIYMQPLGTNAVDYIRHKFKCVGLDVSKYFSDDALSAVKGKCIGKIEKGLSYDPEQLDKSYPMEMQVWMAKAMNLAATIKVDFIDEKFMLRV
ncbi:ExeA family protein [Pseudoalteromonas maricaloris]|uniref:ExeA family protein n=1 Tax=Pseudoalteromonas maricaloris TaxID=184924 RepID=UPI00029AF50F|nr:ATPase, T2SS/T4P/T4SS family [Pseudoalteromonas flavipulchra]